MTNDIRILSVLRKYYEEKALSTNSQEDAAIHNALLHAIKTLESSIHIPSNATNGDVISREAVIRLIEQYPNIIGNRFSGLISDIKHLSPVTPTNEDIKEAYLKGYDYGVKDWFKSKTQPCEDAVSREQVEEITFQEPSYTDPYNILTEVREKVRALSSVTPERPKGKWIDVNGDKSLFECSKCGDKVCCANNNYCPNCGAEMEDGEDDT